MELEKLLHAKEPLAGSMGSIYLMWNGNRYKITNAKSFEAKHEKSKKELAVMGTVRKGTRSTSVKGTWSMGLYYLIDVFREMSELYAETGEDTYFDLQVTNHDPNNKEVGKRTVIYKDCNIDGTVLSKLNIEDEVLDEELQGTFERIDVKSRFNLLSSMQ